MNIYDPADSIRYVHPTGTAVRTPDAAESVPECHRLPAEYANQSPRTLLRNGRTPRATGTGRSSGERPTRRAAQLPERAVTT